MQNNNNNNNNVSGNQFMAQRNLGSGNAFGSASQDFGVGYDSLPSSSQKSANGMSQSRSAVGLNGIAGNNLVNLDPLSLSGNSGFGGSGGISKNPFGLQPSVGGNQYQWETAKPATTTATTVGIQPSLAQLQQSRTGANTGGAGFMQTGMIGNGQQQQQQMNPMMMQQQPPQQQLFGGQQQGQQAFSHQQQNFF
jgi:hypothetical protein